MSSNLSESGDHGSVAIGFSCITEAVLSEAMLSSDADAIIAADFDGIIRFWNPGAVRIFGLPGERRSANRSTSLSPNACGRDTGRVIGRLSRPVKVDMDVATFSPFRVCARMDHVFRWSSR